MVLKYFKAGVQRVKSALQKTRDALGGRLRGLFSRPIDEETLEELEPLLYEADLGVRTAHEITETLQKKYRKDPSLNAEGLIQIIKEEVLGYLNQESATLLDRTVDGPLVILIVGVNGNGKTSSISKLAKWYKNAGKKVIVAAGDTFRAAAIEQLEVWANRLDVEIVKSSPGSDPAAVAFDAVTAAKARDADVVLIDTAGRLHTKAPLMKELEKIRKSCDKVLPGAPHETLLVLDATIGQNAVDQAKTFNQFTPISALVLTKLDSTAKGGIAVSIQRELHLPIAFIGTGEAADDFAPFHREAYVEALFE